MSEKAFLDMLEKGGEAIVRFQPASYSLSPANVNIYARRHSAHSYPTTEQTTSGVSTNFLIDCSSDGINTVELLISMSVAS